MRVKSTLGTKAWLLKAPSTAVKMYVQGRDVFVGRPKSSGEWLCSTILPTSLVNLPYLLEKHGWKRVDGHTALACSAYRKLVLAVAHHAASQHSTKSTFSIHCLLLRKLVRLLKEAALPASTCFLPAIYFMQVL